MCVRHTELRKFMQNAYFYEFGKPLVFVETGASEGRPGEFHELQVTLDPRLGGNVPRVSITEVEFTEGG